MNIFNNGSVIEIDMEEEDAYEIVKTLKCVCGHELYLHANLWKIGYPPGKITMYNSQCTAQECFPEMEFLCKKFQLPPKENKDEERKSWSWLSE